MSRHVRQVAVLGSGVMGSAIAAHFANAGIPALVLDIVPRELTAAERAAGLDRSDRAVRDRIARENVEALARAKPAALFSPARRSLIEVGNLEDDLARLEQADWVIEAVREDMKIKHKVLGDAARHLREDAILSSNTSGLSLAAMAEGLPANLRPRFLGTHFFNPPRYMRLLEIVPTPDTSREVVERVAEFATLRLGKGVVHAKDTPNFIANRIGVHALMATLEVMREHGLSIEEVDAVTGPPLARPKTATFRLADLVGLDVLVLVARTVQKMAHDDECRKSFEPPDYLLRMVERGLLGAKSGGGFYKRVAKPEKKILVVDLETLEYRDARPVDLPELAELRRVDDPRERVRQLVGGDGRAARAAWHIVAASLSYSAMRLGEIADDAATIDRALKLGFNWELGPFEIWDALGFRATVERLRADGYALPEWVDRLYEAGDESLYLREAARTSSPTAAGRAPLAVDPRAWQTEVLRRTRGEIRRNDSASLLDLGDGVLCLEFHTKMNAIDGGTVEMMRFAADEAERNGVALVVANDGEQFSAGANLAMLAEAARAGDWAAIERLVADFQQACSRLESCAVPVVVAPHGLALGGGCEVVLAGNAVHAASESYVGLVEVGAGLLPAGGGCLRLYRRNVARLTDGSDVYPALRATFETIGTAKVAGSAEEARDLGFLRPRDGWSMNRDHRLHDAKQLALGLARAGYEPPQAERAIPVLGRGGLAVIETMLVNMAEARFISGHDRKIGRELGRVLAGGETAGPTRVSESYLLDLEREGFLRLCGEPKTHERIAALLKTGKPLRN